MYIPDNSWNYLICVQIPEVMFKVKWFRCILLRTFPIRADAAVTVYITVVTEAQT